ncbi:GAF domain-containing protein [Geobacter grbiciae]|uniref:GAF domain-containing protein n=1 Tax=Geobacter grbiciae TaxID=155042 RepID=UPI001C0204E2|nr:GAF domain-containing protein [Geobacter grbiciae]MBT1076891.1 GAF domain-containing protein [Geobacter grbiciae]
MSDDSYHKSLNFLFVELLENILRLAENPGECGSYITAQIRELIGVRIVALMQCVPSSARPVYELVSVCPGRAQGGERPESLRRLAARSHAVHGPVVWSSGESPPEAKELLAPAEESDSLVFPLDAGGERVGVLMLLGVMESTGFDTIYASLARLSGVLALVLRNSLLYKDLERKVAERTEKLLWQARVDAALAELYPPLISTYATFRDIALIVLEKAKELTGSDHGYVGIVESETGVMHLNLTTDMMERSDYFASSGGKLSFMPDATGHYGGLWGHSLNTRKPFYTNDPSCHGAASGVPQGHLTVHRFLSVPVVFGHALVAQISLANPPRDYTDTDLGAICRMSEFLALAIQRLRSEEEIRRLNTELERRVHERTAQLEASNRELESFCYSVSHDLRAPLRHIEGYSAMLVEDYCREINDEAHGYLERIRGATAKMEQLIDALLNLSRLSREPLRCVSLDLSQMVRKVAEDLALSEPARSVAFRIAEGVRVHADPVLMGVVMTNLLHNSWKYTANKEDARIEFGTAEANGETVYFIRDNGAGFDMRYVGKLFGAFQRLHSAEEFEGIGIGLTTVQRVIHRHGGIIWAEGRPGEGACFSFTLGSETPPVPPNVADPA